MKKLFKIIIGTLIIILGVAMLTFAFQYFFSSDIETVILIASLYTIVFISIIVIICGFSWFTNDKK